MARALKRLTNAETSACFTSCNLTWKRLPAQPVGTGLNFNATVLKEKHITVMVNVLTADNLLSVYLNVDVIYVSVKLDMMNVDVLKHGCHLHRSPFSNSNAV